MTQSNQNQGMTPDDMAKVIASDPRSRFVWDGCSFIRGSRDFYTRIGRVRCALTPNISWLVAAPKRAEWNNYKTFFWLDGKRIAKAVLEEKLSQVSPG